MADMITPTEAYSTLDQAQRTQLAQQCVLRMRPDGDPECQQFTQMDLSTVTPKQLAQLHEHVADTHPAILDALLRHPILTGALAAFAAHELNKYLHSRS